MAEEFPGAEWIGMDLIPVQNNELLPDNIQFIQDDAATGLGFPDETFDMVHGRFLIAGIRDWNFLIKEITRVLRPGGLFLWVDGSVPFKILGATIEEAKSIAPGFTEFMELIGTAMEKRGFDTSAGRNIFNIVEASNSFVDATQVLHNVPLWPWSDDPAIYNSGLIMLSDTREMVNSARLLIIDSCQITDKEYKDLKVKYHEDIGRPGANMVMPTYHTWAWKK